MPKPGEVTPAVSADTPALTFAEVLAEEVKALTTGALPDPDVSAIPAPKSWLFEEAQILDPQRLAIRLNEGTDRAGFWFGHFLRQDRTVPEKEPMTLVEALVGQLNLLLDTDIYPDAKQVEYFKGVRFRTQTLEAIDQGNSRRRNRLILEDAFPELLKLEDIQLSRLYTTIHDKKLAALCLSGGGIRSATFALGIVQGLARHKVLNEFHYLSTVSGGGYLGGWLSAWINRTGISHVVKRLTDRPDRPLEPEPAPIRHLRSYSNYLSPRLGALSADTWTLVASYLRNLLLNWLVLVPLLVAVMTLPRVVLAIIRWQGSGGELPVQLVIGEILALLGIGFGILAVRYVHTNRPVQQHETEGEGLLDKRKDQADFLRRCLTPLVGASFVGVLCWAWVSYQFINQPWPRGLVLGFAAAGLLVHGTGYALSQEPSPTRPNKEERIRRRREAAFVLMTGIVAGVVLWLAAVKVPALLRDYSFGVELYASLGVPVLVLTIMTFSHLYIGFTSNTPQQSDAVREWASRYSAWLLIVAIGWLAAFGIAILGPIAVHYLEQRPKAVVAFVKGAVAVIGTVSGWITLREGKGSHTPGDAGSAGAPLTRALKLAAPTFIVFLAQLFAWLGARAIAGARWGLRTFLSAIGEPGSASFALLSLMVLLVLIGLGYGIARFINTNKFSLHALYRARLIRAYLGASRPAGSRDPNPFTGFDDNDNLHMHELVPPSPIDQPAGIPQERRLLHIVNVALNLVGGDNLAWQERKAESFTMDALHCGARQLGYRRTCIHAGSEQPVGYAGKEGITLGTAMTISGAAVSPNMGYHSSPVISFLLTLFNVRLGWWLGNPGWHGRKVFQLSAPESSLQPIVDEATGRTDDKNDYVYLSDGGHFENLGLYEMVLRRCHTIVVSDGGFDPACSFEDLGNAVRKIRIDLGIPIVVKEVQIHSREGEDGTKPRAGKYCAIGRIEYKCVDGDGVENGTLIYIKPAFYQTEPIDVFNYAKKSGKFPHESTADQFFTESQFESYRALGSHVIEEMLTEAPGDPPAPPEEEPRLVRFSRLIGNYLRRDASQPAGDAGT